MSLPPVTHRTGLVPPRDLSAEDRAAHDRLRDRLSQRGTPTLTIELLRVRVAYLVTAMASTKRGAHSSVVTSCASADTVGEALCEAARQMGIDL